MHRIPAGVSAHVSKGTFLPRLIPVIGIPWILAAPLSRAALVIGVPERVPARLPGTVEFRIPVQGAHFQNPYDPDQVRVDAEVRGPSGHTWNVPGFWFQPYTRIEHDVAESLERIRLLRFFVASADFRPAPWNRPVRVRVTGTGEVRPAGVLPGLLHGLKNHPDLHNPVTFEVDYPRDGRFVLRVGEVSGWGGVALRILLDGKPMCEKTFSDDAPDSHASIPTYAGEYSIPVPRGRHTIVVENTGRDWFRVLYYRLEPYAVESKPRLSVLGLESARVVLLWVRNRQYCWFNPLIGRRVREAREVQVTIDGLSPGKWTADVFDPQSGEWTRRKAPVALDLSGSASISLGDVRYDAALRLLRGNAASESAAGDGR